MSLSIHDVAQYLDIYPSSTIIKEIPIQRLLTKVVRNLYEISIQNIQHPESLKLFSSAMHEVEALLSQNEAPFETLLPEQTTHAINQVMQINRLLTDDTPYIVLWEMGDVQCVGGTLIFSKQLRQTLNDHIFKQLLKVLPQEFRENITTCSLIDTFEFTEKSFETALKYLPNISEKSLCEIGQSALDMWNTLRLIDQKERQNVFLHAKKCFNRRILSEEKALIIEAVAKIAKEDRADVVNHVVKISQSFLSNALKIESLLYAVALLPKEDRCTIVNEAIFSFEIHRSPKCPIIAVEAAAMERKKFRDRMNQSLYPSTHAVGTDKNFLDITPIMQSPTSTNFENVPNDPSCPHKFPCELF